MISTRLGSTAMSGPLTRTLIGGAQPKKRLVGPRHATPYRGGRDWRLMNKIHCCRQNSPPRNPNPIREGGLQRREAPPLPPSTPTHCRRRPCRRHVDLRHLLQLLRHASVALVSRRPVILDYSGGLPRRHGSRQCFLPL